MTINLNQRLNAEVQRDAIATELAKDSDLSEFVEALKDVNPSNVQAAELTIFAVSNAGMSKSALKSTGDVVMSRHVVEGRYRKSSLTDSLTMQALDGSTLLVVVLDGQIYINELM